MVFAVDVDNTICNLQEVVTSLFNQRYGTNYSLDDFTEYNVENSLSVKEAVAMKEMYGEYGIYDNVRPIDGAQDALQKLINAGHSVYLVTDAIPKNYNEKIAWINHYFPFIDVAHVIAMKHKWLLRVDVMIDDCLDHILARPYYDRIVFDHPWNRNVHDEVYGIHRCSSWNEIMDVVNKIKEEE